MRDRKDSPRLLPGARGVEAPSVCAACGGVCCKNQPGAVFPEDVGFPEEPERLISMLRSGRYAIDWWEGDIDPEGDLDVCYFVRPAARGREGQTRHASWGNDPCTFLTETGCALPFEERPRGCRMLTPGPEGKDCQPREGSTKADACRAWRPYHEELVEIIVQIESGYFQKVPDPGAFLLTRESPYVILKAERGESR